MELHCSQTEFPKFAPVNLFETPMELHCSQTRFAGAFQSATFETPMELHCSQTQYYAENLLDGLRPLWNYTALKLYQSLFYQ